MNQPPQLACDVSRLPGALPARLAAVKNAGFDGCILGHTDLQASGLSKPDLEEFLEMAELQEVALEGNSLRSGTFSGRSNIGVAPELDQANNLSFVVIEDFEPSSKSEDLRHYRPLGLGSVNNASFVKALVRRGFSGTWAVCPEAGMGTGASTNDLVRDAYRGLVTLLDDVRRELPSNSFLAGPAMPARATCQGIEFIEFKSPK